MLLEFQSENINYGTFLLNLISSIHEKTSGHFRNRSRYLLFPNLRTYIKKNKLLQERWYLEYHRIHPCHEKYPHPLHHADIQFV